MVLLLLFQIIVIYLKLKVNNDGNLKININLKEDINMLPLYKRVLIPQYICNNKNKCLLKAYAILFITLRKYNKTQFHFENNKKLYFEFNIVTEYNTYNKKYYLDSLFAYAFTLSCYNILTRDEYSNIKIDLEYHLELKGDNVIKHPIKFGYYLSEPSDLKSRVKFIKKRINELTNLIND